jgi:hypothetical protein
MKISCARRPGRRGSTSPRSRWSWPAPRSPGPGTAPPSGARCPTCPGCPSPPGTAGWRRAPARCAGGPRVVARQNSPAPRRVSAARWPVRWPPDRPAPRDQSATRRAPPAPPAAPRARAAAEDTPGSRRAPRAGGAEAERRPSSGTAARRPRARPPRWRQRALAQTRRSGRSAGSAPPAPAAAPGRAGEADAVTPKALNTKACRRAGGIEQIVDGGQVAAPVAQRAAPAPARPARGWR